MRHGNKVNALGRTKSHRDAMLKNMASSLIEHKRITTTLAKAKSLRVYLEPLVTKSKSNTTHNRRVVFSYLQDKKAVDSLFSEIRESIGDRPGGYLRIIKLGQRSHDASEMAMIEFVDFNTIYNPNEVADGKKKTRRKRAKSKNSGTKSATASDKIASEVTEPANEVVSQGDDIVSEVASATDTVVAEVEQKTEEAIEQVEKAVDDAVEDSLNESKEA